MVPALVQFLILSLFCVVSGVFLSLKGQFIANYGYVDVNDIGEGDDALLCHTNKTDCCRKPPNRAGEWYYPEGYRVGVQGVGFAYYEEFYRDRGNGVVRLNRRQDIIGRLGVFRCEIPDANNNIQDVHVNVGM
jgi:hypothetical protein